MMSKLKRKKKIFKMCQKGHVISELDASVKVYDTWIGSIRLVCLLLSVCGCLVSGLDAFQMVALVDSHSQGRRRDEGEDTGNSDDSITIVCITEEYPSGDIQHVE